MPSMLTHVRSVYCLAEDAYHCTGLLDTYCFGSFGSIIAPSAQPAIAPNTADGQPPAVHHSEAITVAHRSLTASIFPSFRPSVRCLRGEREAPAHRSLSTDHL